MNFQGIVRAYDRLLDSGADDARAVGWRNAESQMAKFAQIALVFAGEAGPFTVYDVGCGLGNLYDFLRRTYPLSQYAGCDIHPRMIERARLKHPGIEIEQRDVLRSPPPAKYDYVVASGTFNLRLNHSKSQWQAYVRKMLQTFFSLSRRGISAGFLSSFAAQKERSEYHADPSELLRFAQRRLSPLAEVRHSASPGSFALLVYHSPRVVASVARE